jgi:hypothetical protein
MYIYNEHLFLLYLHETDAQFGIGLLGVTFQGWYALGSLVLQEQDVRSLLTIALGLFWHLY